MLALEEIEDVGRRSVGRVLDEGSLTTALTGDGPGEFVACQQAKAAHQERGLLGSEQHHTFAQPQLPDRAECRPPSLGSGLAGDIHDLRSQLFHLKILPINELRNLPGSLEMSGYSPMFSESTRRP